MRINGLKIGVLLKVSLENFLSILISIRNAYFHFGYNCVKLCVMKNSCIADAYELAFASGKGKCI